MVAIMTIHGELTRCRNCGRWVQVRNVTVVDGEEYGPKCSRKVASWAAALAAQQQAQQVKREAQALVLGDRRF